MKKLLIAATFSLGLFLSVAEKSEANTCHAYTACYNGYTIQCTTYGFGCTWFVQPYQYVQCTGLDPWGQWVNMSYSCF